MIMLFVLPENVEELINLRVTGEKGFVVQHLSEDASYTPHVQSDAIDVLKVKDNHWKQE